MGAITQRSQGCPAVPVRIHHQLIDLIKGNNCVFIYHPSYAQHTAQYAPMFITKAYRGEQD
ncbi:MAG: murein L,D-transpeptidase catalytic domain-containing protein [Sphingomonadales bacterium]